MWRRNGLSIVLFALMAVFLVAQALTGWQVHNEELAQHGLKSLPFWSYLTTGHFSSATFENWESEFLQMGMYVLLTVRLRQAGSAESRPLDPAEEEPRVGSGPVPCPCARGTSGRASTATLWPLFSFSCSSSPSRSRQWEVGGPSLRTIDGLLPPSFTDHLSSSDFWFESMQNWQSEFLAVLAQVVLTIFLRQKDSPQSKAAEAPHSQTGD